MTESRRESVREALLRQASAALADIVPEEGSRSQILDRFFRQYLPAFLQSSASTDTERVWQSFLYYVTAPSTSRKPFNLSMAEGERLILALVELLPGPLVGEG